MLDTYKYGVEMNENDEVFCCELQVFQSHYLPQCQLPAADFEARCNAGLKRAQSLFEENRKFTSEADISRHLSQVVDAILGSRKNSGKRLWLSLDQKKTNVSAILGGNFRVDSCLKNDKRGPLRTTNIIAPMEIQLSRNYGSIHQNRLRLASAVVQIMNDDVRRVFIFGITVEAHRMSLWYFSRNHSVKTQSFDFVKNSDILVSVLISLVFADDRDLGFDPNIALKPNTKRQFIYTVHGRTGPRHFLTTHSISENRAFRRMTRVFRVVELDGQTDSPQQDAKPMILKDAWLDKGAKTEKEIQQELFADIKIFAENPDWRKHNCLSAFNQEEDVPIMDAFGKLLEGESYKDLFLVIQDSSTGESIKQLTRSAWRAKSRILFPTLDSVYANDPFSSTKRQMAPGSDPSGDLQNDLPDQGAKPEFQQHTFKQRTFVVFDDECTPLYCLPTIGDVFTVLNDCVGALRLMFCAGWVHRDISCNNVMALHDPETQQWKLKLADLEYSKKFELNTGTSDPKTGTPFFMPCEILRGKYFGLANVGPITARSRLEIVPGAVRPSMYPLFHNFLHDLEASFWTSLWIVTSRVNHERSKTHFLNTFQNTSTLTLSEVRLNAFEMSIQEELDRCLLEALRNLAKTFEVVRHYLHVSATMLGQQRAWCTRDGYKIYSSLHANFAAAFAHLANPQAVWAAVRLQVSTSSSPRPMDAIADEDPNELPVTPYSGEGEGALHLCVKRRNPDEEVRAPADVPSISGRKRSHHDVEQADANDGEGRSSDSKRVKSNDGGRISASGPSEASTSAGSGARYTLAKCQRPS